MIVDGFNHRQLSLARECRGLTQAELAKSAGLSQARLSKIENGLVPVDEKDLGQLASALSLPSRFFLRAVEPIGLPLRYHRKRQSVPKRELNRAHAWLSVLHQHIEVLWANVEGQGLASLPRLDVDDHEGDAEEIARMVRATWLLPKGPIDNLTSILERAGIVVFELDLGTVGIDAIGFPPKANTPAIIFSNVHTPGDRQRFTLAHELGHLVMHLHPPRNAQNEMERQADTFASEFLMPRSETHPRLRRGRVDLGMLAAEKQVWKVSMQVVLMKAKETGMVSERQARWLWMQIGKYGYRTREPYPIPRERPRLLKDILEAHTHELNYTMEDLGQLLCLLPEELPRLYSCLASKHGHLRVVR
jgi:Zn-dependent peptidase ImmA (M78 family)/DNA-binding XRE family transcriptional regulator